MTNSIRLADGTLIDTKSGKRTVGTEINNAFSNGLSSGKDKSGAETSYSSGARRYLDDLPVPAAQSRPIAAVAAYTIFGLSAADVAFILNTSIDTVEELITTSEYKSFVEAMLQNIREHDENVVRKKLNANAEKAAKKIASLVDNTDAKVAFAASKDILDRTGHKASDVIEHRHSMDDGIVIRIIDDSKAKKSIEVEI